MILAYSADIRHTFVTCLQFSLIYDRRDTQAVRLIYCVHVTEKFHSVDRAHIVLLKTAVIGRTYAIRIDNVSKLFAHVRHRRLCSGHGRVIHFLLSVTTPHYWVA
jgi:hypothetical protein